MVKEGKWKDKIYAYALKNAIEHDGKAISGAVISSLFHEGLKKEEAREVVPEINKIVAEVNKLGLERQKDEFEKLKQKVSKREVREGLPELPNVKGKVIMRVAPFPSGPLHIGNAKQLILNDEYAKMYKGKLLLIIDDTIGSEEKQIVKEAYKMIEEGAKWLGVKYEKPIIYKSVRLKIYYDYACELIKKEKAYVCYCSAETLRKNRVEKVECGHRKQTAEETLKEWKKMFKMKEGQATLRLKTSMSHENPAFRDRVLFRISEREHPRIGKKYKVWPLLEFSWAVDDHLLEITHVVRGKELMIETEMEKYIFNIFGWKYPEFIHTGLLQFEGVKLSKSKGQKEIREGRYFGWHDSRTWSLQSLEKRGIEPEAIRKFIVDLGVNQNEITIPIDVLYSINRKLIHDKAKAASFKENGKGKARVIMPDGKIIKGDSDVKIKDSEIVYFKNLGYCKYDKNENLFYFAHK